MWELDYKESWALKNWYFWTSVLEKTLESPLDCKEIQPVHPKGDQSCGFIGGTNVEAETPILWPHDAESWLIWKDSDAEKDWGQEEEGTAKGWNRWMASPTQWTWVWVDSGSWWWTGRPGVLRFMGSGTELNWTELKRHSDSETTIKKCHRKRKKKCHRNITRWWLIPASLFFPFFFSFLSFFWPYYVACGTSPTRDWTRAYCGGSLNHWTTGEVQFFPFKNKKQKPNTQRPSWCGSETCLSLPCLAPLQ